MPRNFGIAGSYMKIHSKYLVLRYLMKNGFLIVNWMDRKYFRLEGKVGAKMSRVSLPVKASSDINTSTEDRS